jgi:hypothetical protein
MVLNRKGQVFLYYLMVGITLIVLGIAFANPIKLLVDEQLNNLTCDTPSTDFIQGLCWIMDSYKFLVVGTFILIGIGLIFAKTGGFI